MMSELIKEVNLIEPANKKLAKGDIETIRLLNEVQENLSLINGKEVLLINYKKNNNKCPYCKDNNYLVYGSYKDNEFTFIPDFEKYYPKYKTLKIGNKIFKYTINIEKFNIRKSMLYTSKTVKV